MCTVHTYMQRCVICTYKIEILNRSVKETNLEIVMGRMSLATRSRVISMWKNGYQLSKIRARLLEEGVAVAKKSLCLNIRKYKLTGSVADRRTYKQPKKLNDAHYRLIDNRKGGLLMYTVLVLTTACTYARLQLAIHNVAYVCTCKGFV